MADSRKALTKNVQARIAEVLRLMEEDEKLSRPLAGSTVTFGFSEQDVAWYVAYKTAEA